MIGATFLIGTGSILVLLIIIAVMPPSAAARATPWVTGELGAPGAFREPADPEHVDSLIRAHASAKVIHRPDPLPASPALASIVSSVFEPVTPDLTDLPTTRANVSPYQISLAELIRMSRARQIDIERAATRIGQHRAPELLAA